MKDFDYQKLSPNIRRVVKQLHDWRYETTDSGDGTNHKEGMECAFPYPMVSIDTSIMPSPYVCADTLHSMFKRLRVPRGEKCSGGPVRSIQVGYSSADCIVTMLLLGVSDSDLPKED